MGYDNSSPQDAPLLPRIIRKGFSFVVFSLLFFLLLTPLSGSVHAGAASPEAMIAWTTDNGHGEQVYFSRYEQDSWSPPVQLSDERELVFQPVAGSGTNGRIWVIWSRQDKDGSHLQYSVRNGERWEKPRLIDTGMNSNTAAAVVVDRDNIPWLVWTGVEDTYPDIFWSRWNGRDWERPEKVNQNNNVPDLDPSLTLDEFGHVLVSWRTFAKGRYSTVTRSWDGKQWVTALSEPVTNRRKDSADFVRTEMAPLPTFVTDPRKATLHIQYKGGACSILLSQLGQEHQ